MEYSEDTLHLWHLDDQTVRFAVQNGREERYRRNDYSEEFPKIAPWAFAIDVELECQDLLAVLDKVTDEMRRILTEVFAPAECPAFDEALPVADWTLYRENGRRYDYFAPYRWIVGECHGGYEYFILPHMQRHLSPPHNVDFSVRIHDAPDEEFLMTLTHKKVRIGLLMPEWTHWEEDLCQWLNLLIDGNNSVGRGTVCFNTEGIDAVLCGEEDRFWHDRNPDADSRLVNFLVWANGSWYTKGSPKRKEWKDRAIHIKI